MQDHLSDQSAAAVVENGTPTDGGQQFCGDLDLRIGHDGTWFYHGSPIGRKEMVCLFASLLCRDEAGDYWLETPAETCRIQVDDAPFLAVEMFAEGCGADQTVSLRTNVDEIVTVDDDHPVRVETDPATGEPHPYVHVRGGLEARLTRSVYYDLVARGAGARVDGEDLYGLWSSGRFFPLGRLDAATTTG